MRLVTIALLTCLVAASALAEPIVLAKAGRPEATIVIPADANSREKQAAQELQHYVAAICGVELPVNEDGKQVAGTGLYIGRCEPTTAADLPAADLNPETYAIGVRGGSVFFTGKHPSPTYFAVSSFIEESLGVRWFAPGDEWEYLPPGTPGELTVEASSLVKVPDTSPRIWSGHAWCDDWKTWNLRNKTILSEVVPRRQFQNRIQAVFPSAKYGKTHPEYYPLINGERWIPPSKGGSHWRPCESNPEVQRLTVEYARKWFDSHPTIDSFSLGMDDISHMCGCANCRALDPHPDSYEQRQFSDRHYKFVNAIAREVARTHPDRYIGTLIYNIARELPETVDKLEDNVFGFITETSALWWEPGRKEADHELTREWARRCKHLSRYDYYGMGTMTPRVYPHTMSEQIKFDKSLGLEGMYTEVYTFLPDTAPMIWAFAKLQWDATCDIDALLWDYYSKMFGPAAETMKQYFDLLERSWNTPRPGRRGWVHRNLRNQALAMSPEDVDAGFHLLTRALHEADSKIIKERIKTVRAGLRYGSYPIRALGLSRRVGDLNINSEASAQEALGIAAEMGKLAAQRENFWAAASRRDDLLGETVRGLGNMQYLATGQMASTEGPAWSAAIQALVWYQRNAPDKVTSAAEKLAKAAPGSESAQLVCDAAAVLAEQPTNLLTNGDFEDLGKNTATPERDWETEDAPKGWNTWASGGRGTHKVIAGKGIDGSVAAAIQETGSACFLQSIKVTAGERYLCLAWVKSEPPKLHSGVALGIRYNTTKGGWHPRRDLEPLTHPPAGLAGWQLLALAVTVPEDAGRLIVMPSAKGQDPGATALFDNIALYRLPAE